MAGQLRCNSCGGTYPDTTAPGSVAYLHVCPSEFILEHAVCDPKTGEIVTPAKYAPMPNPRNENPRFNPETKQYEITAEGHGVTKV